MEKHMHMHMLGMSTATYFLFCMEEEELVLLNSRRKHRYWMAPYLKERINPYQRNTLAKLEMDFIRLGSNDEFRMTLRMPVHIYQELLEKVSPIIQRQNTNYRVCISPDERLSMTMRYLSLGDSTRTLHQSYLVGYSTVQPLIRDTCRAIYSVLHEDYMKTPSTKQEWLDIASGFNTRWNMPHVLGSVDGKHVRIRCPKKSGSLFFNYKSYFSIVLMAVVDSDYRFIFVDAGAEGRASDSRVWHESQFFKDISSEENILNLPDASPIEGIRGNIPYYFVGDDAFALGQHLMKPFPTTASTIEQHIFNYRISRCRRIVENAFGILASRFRLFMHQQDMEPNGVQIIIMTAVVLHNYLRTRCSETYMGSGLIDQEDKDHRIIEGQWRQQRKLDPVIGHQMNRNTSLYVKNMRATLASWCVSKYGEVPWQYRAVQN